MKKVVCNYAPMRFLPYREIGEFVNVGVILNCPQMDYFGYRLVPAKRTARATAFFPELDAKIFKAALRGVERELTRVKVSHRLFPFGNEQNAELVGNQLQWFREIIRRREGLLHFGEPGTLIAESPDEALDYLFGRFVERQFAQKKEYHETIMRNRLAGFLRDWELARYYEINKKIGDDDFHVVMPFVNYRAEIAAKAIKPLDLNKTDTSEIYHHGGAWVKNMERLKVRGKMPLRVVFTVRLPENGKRLKAAQEICDEFGQLGVEPIPFGDKDEILNAVRIDVAA